MKIRDVIGALSRNSAERGQALKARTLLTGAAAAARGKSGSFASQLRGIAQMKAIEDEELGNWIEPDEIDQPGLKRFDVCDLRFWLELARRADVPAVPARKIASLTDDELEQILPKIKVPDALRKTILQGMKEAVTQGEEGDPSSDADLASLLQYMAGSPIDVERAGDLMAQADSYLDDIPSDWMVRTHVCGSGNLKALVGTGLMLRGDDTAKVSDKLEIGGGWIRVGNRRMIDFSDPRFIELGVRGHKPVTHYLARPWMQPARFHEGEDIHRSGSPLAGPGRWPAEWRVFVQSGRVTGVANYYCWTGQGATPENAFHAIEAAAAAQKIVDVATSARLSGIYMDQVFIRKNQNAADLTEVLDREWPEDEIHCTLDFMETTQGLMLLEGGPGHLPIGGGHPCAFAGFGISDKRPGSASRCHGVAYKAMPHINIADPRSWTDGDPADAIEVWQDAAQRAIQHGNLSPDAILFLNTRNALPSATTATEPSL